MDWSVQHGVQGPVGNLGGSVNDLLPCSTAVDSRVDDRAAATGVPPGLVGGRVRSNQVREMPGGAVRLVHGGFGQQPHITTTTTPTGHSSTSRAGPAP